MNKTRKRALSPSEVCRIKHKTFPLSPRWARALGEPAVNGVWFIYGASGNGKSSFVMQLCKELCRHGKVIYNSLEEGFQKSFSDSLNRHDMRDCDRRLELYEKLPLDTLKKVLQQKRRPNIAIIDSIQEANFGRVPDYKKWIAGLEDKLLIFISQVDGKRPLGSVAKTAEYDAMIKIRVDGMRAECKSRFATRETTGYFDIWEERSIEVWQDGTCLLNKEETDNELTESDNETTTNPTE